MGPKEAKQRSDVKARKTASIVSMVVGAPNLIISLLTLIAGLGGLGFLIFLLVAFLLDDQGKDDFMAGLCIVLLIVFVIIAIVILVIALIILVILAFAISSQVIGSILAYKGKRFKLSIGLLAIGAVITFVLGMVLLLGGLISAIDEKTIAFIPLALWGLYNIFSSIVTTICIVVISGKKHTFVKVSSKEGPSKRKPSISSSR